MVSEHVTKACKILRVIATISGSRVFKAALDHMKDIKLTLNRDDKLRNDGEHLGTTFFKHIKDTLDSEETVWVLLLSDAFKENGEIMVIV
jgi:hypothetical protein